MRKKRAGPAENLSGAGAGSIASVAAGSGRLFFLAKAGEADANANRQANTQAHPIRMMTRERNI